MGGARQGDAVADDIWPVVFDRSDMGGLNFCTSTTVDKPEAGDCTSFSLGPEHRLSEITIPNGAVCQLFDTIPGGKVLEGLLLVIQFILCSGRVDSRQEILIPSEAKL